MKAKIRGTAARAALFVCGFVAQVGAYAQASGQQEQVVPAADQQTKQQSPQPKAQSGTGAEAPSNAGMDHQEMQMGVMPGMQMTPGQDKQIGAMQGMQKGPMQGMQMGPMQGGEPPPGARDPNAYGEGTRHANLPGNEMLDQSRFGRLLVDNLEAASGDGEHGQNFEAEGWYGDDYNRAWLKAEGERRDGRLKTLRTEALWNRAFATYWSTQLGVRHDTGGGNARNWLAFGVQGLAPYWFETEATAYWRSGGAFAVRTNVKYELLFTQRVILEPELEANLYSQADPERRIGSGLSNLSVGLRLRYEIRRQFGPYVGVTWDRNFGGTARFAEAEGRRRQTVQAVAGVRMWF